jgi:hypothetical protein
MRNVGEHIDEYALDQGKANVERGELQAGRLDDDTYYWRGYVLNGDDALAAAEQLFIAVREASKRAVQASPHR